MKNSKIAALAISVLALGGCTGMNEIVPQSGTLLSQQVVEVTTSDPSRIDAVYTGMYTKLGTPKSCGYSTPDDFGFIMIGFSGDLEAADALMPNSGYNWFSVCGELSSRTATYRNPLIRYKICYDVISAAHDVINAIDTLSTDPAVQAKFGEAKAIRAFAYLNLVPYFQFGYNVPNSKGELGKDLPCVPLVTLQTTDFANNPRAKTSVIYNLIISDLTSAIEKLKGWERSDKSKLDQQVVYGLRARAYLNMGKYAEAAADAEKAVAGYEPASMAEVSVPFLYDIKEHNWMWGYDMTQTLADLYIYANSSSWLRSFSGYGYSAACQTYCMINSILYNKIPDTDVRKGWWVNEALYSPLLDGLTWKGYSGQDIAMAKLPDEKEAFLPYTNVKFGCNPVGTTTNEEDWCWMRAEEMFLIQAEGYAKSGNADKAKQILNTFVQTYRDPAYDCTKTGRSLEDEIWFQRRVELWGEGFSNNDTRRLGKPLVRFHGGDKTSNYPEAFRFNMAADDGWWLMRFSQKETNTNAGVVDNTEGSIPTIDQLPDLLDGVTD